MNELKELIYELQKVVAEKTAQQIKITNIEFATGNGVKITIDNLNMYRAGQGF